MTTPRPAPARILIVDDAPDVLAFVELLLADAGYTVETAATPAAARQALIDRPPDLVIMDVRLPGAAPFAVLDLVDGHPQWRTLPVVVCTGADYALTDHSERLQRPRTRMLAKPFDIDDLLQCVAQLLDSSSP